MKTISLRKRSDGGWMLDLGIVEGKRKRLTFGIYEDALREKEMLTAERKKYGESMYMIPFNVRADVHSAIAMAADRVSLTTAVSYWIDTHPACNGVSLKDAMREYLTLKTNSGKRKATIDEISIKIGVMVKSMGPDSPIGFVNAPMIESMLSSRKLNARSRNQYIRVFHCFFSWAVKVGYIMRNPIEGVLTSSVDPSQVYTHTADQIRSVFQSCESMFPEMLPYYVLGYFTGIRHDELLRMDWTKISIERKTVLVTAQIAKKRKTRHVDLPDVAIAWLMRCQKKDGQIQWKRSSQESLLKKAGVEWHNRVMRHTYATWHLHAHKNSALTAYNLGHTNSNLLYNTYAGEYMTEEQAKQIAELYPQENGGIIDLKTA